MRRFAAVLLWGLLPFGLSAGRLMLRDGSVIYGRFISGTADSIVFQDQAGVRRRFSTTQVQTIDFDSPTTTADRNQPPNEILHTPGADSRDRIGNTGPQAAWVTLPAGASISVRNDEEINSQTAIQGRTYPATIVQDVLDESGRIAIPRGAEAALVIRQVNEGGTLSNGNFVLDLDSIRLNGRRYAVDTADVRASDEKGIGKNKRTAEMVGGGAVLGTLLGAIAGGGKGAAIGAAAGAAAGGGAQVLTKGHEVRVPAETILSFRLEQPLTLREAH